MSSILNKFRKNGTDKKDGLVKQSVDSIFTPKPRKRYLDTFLKFPSQIYDTPKSSGVTPIPIPPPDLLYVAEGYVEDGYV